MSTRSISGKDSRGTLSEEITVKCRKTGANGKKINIGRKITIGAFEKYNILRIKGDNFNKKIEKNMIEPIGIIKTTGTTNTIKVTRIIGMTSTIRMIRTIEGATNTTRMTRIIGTTRTKGMIRTIGEAISTITMTNIIGTTRTIRMTRTIGTRESVEQTRRL
jgi:hypothetical protein